MMGFDIYQFLQSHSLIWNKEQIGINIALILVTVLVLTYLYKKGCLTEAQSLAILFLITYMGVIIGGTVLLPVMWVYRPFEIFAKRRKQARSKLRYVANADADRAERNKELFERVI